MRVRNICFTLNNYTPENIQALKGMDIIRYCIIGEEVAPKTGTPHLQGYIQLGKQIRFNGLIKLFHSLDMKPHIENARGTPEQNINYCKGLTKKKTPNEVVHEWGELKAQGRRSDIEDLYEMVKEGRTDVELMEESPRDYAKYYKAIDRMRQNLTYETNKKYLLESSQKLELRPWQSEALKVLEEQDDRQVLWVVDPVGNNGKTTLAKYLTAVNDAFYVQNGKCTDIAYAYNYEEYVVFDFTRSQEEHINYSVIESFKNGLIFSPKYNSNMKLFRPCKVIVMSNFMPDLSKLSKDRWNIMRLGDSITPTSETDM